MKAFFKKEKGRKVEDGTAFIRNGAMVLEKLISLCDGKCNPIRCFSAEELKIATNNYDASQILSTDSFFKLYKGFVLDRPIIVKKYVDTFNVLSLASNDIPYASRMSVHNNVLKFLGWCLETESPILVFEFFNNGTYLYEHLYSPQPNFMPLLWKRRLKLAMDIANVVTYLHTAFPKPIIHRNIKPGNILLDEHCVAKLTDFSYSIPIPHGKTHVKDRVAGTSVFIAPEYLRKGCFNEKHDVFSFGVCLLALLTGKGSNDYYRNDTADEARDHLANDVKKSIELSRFNEIVDPIIVGEGPWPGKDEELQSFAVLALRCVNEIEDNRPAMIDVAKELRQIYRSGNSPV